MDEIRRAQRLTMTMSPIKSYPAAHRTIRQIVRGEYLNVNQQAMKGLRRQRMFLVATDLSDEAAYALEWTIGTVLKDGDTLLAIYAVDVDVGTGAAGGASNNESHAIGIGEGAKIMTDTAKDLRNLNAIESLTVPGAPRNAMQSVMGKVKDDSPARSRTPMRQDLSHMKRPERERWLATEQITERCISLLRKTRLQVRVVIEVFHCRSPRHMLTEVVSFLTLPAAPFSPPHLLHVTSNSTKSHTLPLSRSTTLTLPSSSSALAAVPRSKACSWAHSATISSPSRRCPSWSRARSCAPANSKTRSAAPA